VVKEDDVSVFDPFAADEDQLEGQTTVDEQIEDNDTTRTPNQRYAAAEKELRKAHQDEFQALLEAEYAKDGVTYRPRLSAAERAARDEARKREAAAERIRKIKEQFPDLEV
jgi:hypothetical protein